MPGHGTLRATARVFSSSTGVKVAQAGASLAATALLARLLGPGGFGIYAFAYAAVSLIAMPTTFGIPQLVVRETARHAATGDWPAVKTLWRWATVRVIGLATLAAAALIGIGIYKGAWRGDSVGLTLALGALLVPLIALGNLRGNALRGLGHVVVGQLPERVFRPALLAGVAVLLYLWQLGPLSAPVAIGLHAVAAGVAFGAGAWLLHRRRPAALRFEQAGPAMGRTWWRASWPLGLSAGMLTVVQHTDVLMLGLLRPDAEAGVYRAAAQTALLVVFGAQAVNAAIAPAIAGSHSQGDTATLRRTTRFAAQAMAVTALPFAAVFIFAGRDVLTLVFGAGFATGGAALAVLAAGRAIHATFGPVGVLLNMTGHERAALQASAFAAGANLLLNAALIPSLGLIGAAIATTLALVLWNAMLWLAVRRKLGFQPAAIGPADG